MTDNTITTKVNPKQLKFKPGEQPAYFEVEVINESDRFASFQLEVIAAGAGSNQNYDWYNVSPEVSTKKPPGDITRFHVAIKDSPVPGFVGMMNLTVRAFSIELRDEDREILRLNLEQGRGLIPLQLTLPVDNFQEYPGAQINIPVRVYNPSQLPAEAFLNLLGLEPQWLVNGVDHNLEIPPGKEVETTLTCQLPEGKEAVSKNYTFTIDATQRNGPASQISGTLEVLPSGFVDFAVDPPRQVIPTKKFSWAFWRSHPVSYELQFKNESNVEQEVGVDIEVEDPGQSEFEILPENAEINPGEIGVLLLQANSKRPWLFANKILLQINALWSDRRLDTRNETQNIELLVKPIVPLWLRLLGLFGLLFLAFQFSPFNPSNTKHKEAVNSVQLNGVGEQIISSSQDQRIIAWRVDGFSFWRPLLNPKIGVVGNAEKEVRVATYRPVNNNLVAAGLENGEIQIWNLLENRQRPIESFSAEKDDRVLALEFTNNSRFLISGHGSGKIILWDLKKEADEDITTRNPLPLYDFNSTVESLKFAGEDDSNLLIAGRYNKFSRLNLSEKKVAEINNYPQGGKDNYIEAIDVAEFKPYRVVTADNQGRITLWNMRECLLEGRECEIIDQWLDGHGKNPVRSVALSADGCYLVSSGDDGKVKFWPLDKEGSRSTEFSKGKNIEKGKESFNSVDIREVGKKLVIASGNDDKRVRVAWQKRLPRLGCDQFR